ncbi:hypothetical protein Tco_0463331, partial [Tanacetum coccineum]
ITDAAKAYVENTEEVKGDDELARNELATDDQAKGKTAQDSQETTSTPVTQKEMHKLHPTSFSLLDTADVEINSLLDVQIQ